MFAAYAALNLCFHNHGENHETVASFNHNDINAEFSRL